MSLLNNDRKKVIAIIIISILMLLIIQGIYQNFRNPEYSKNVTYIAWHPHDDKFVSINDQDGTILFWQWEGEEYKVKFSVENKNMDGGGVHDFSWHPSGKLFAIANLFDGMYVYDDEGNLVQYIEEYAIYAFDWSPNGSEIAIMVIDKDSDPATQIRVSEVDINNEFPIIYNQYRIISPHPAKQSISNFVKWYSEDILVVATSGSSNSDDGRIESIYLEESGPMLNITAGQVYQVQLDTFLGLGLLGYTVDNGSEQIGDTLYIYDYSEYRIINLTTFDTVGTFTQTELGTNYIDPITKNLVGIICDGEFSTNCQVIIRDIHSFSIIESYDFLDSNPGRLYWHPSKNVVARISSSTIQILSTETFESI